MAAEKNNCKPMEWKTVDQFKQQYMKMASFERSEITEIWKKDVNVMASLIQKHQLASQHCDKLTVMDWLTRLDTLNKKFMLLYYGIPTSHLTDEHSPYQFYSILQSNVPTCMKEMGLAKQWKTFHCVIQFYNLLSTTQQQILLDWVNRYLDSCRKPTTPKLVSFDSSNTVVHH